MLGNIDLSQKVDKKEYKKEIKILENRLAELQQTVRDLKIPIAIVIDGWSAAGKGTLINKILYPLDPRYFNVYTMNKVQEEAYMRPFLWSYYTRTPSKGRIAIFDKSWHRVILPEGIEKWRLSDEEKSGFYYDINAFERQLYDDGVLLIKMFLHISKDEQKKRFNALEKNDDSSWRVDKGDWEQNHRYDQYLRMYESMIQNTNKNESQWTVIESNDDRFAALKGFRIIINKIENEIEKRKSLESVTVKTIPMTIPSVSILSSINLDVEISEEDYKQKIEYLQNKIADQGNRMYKNRRSVIIVYEGWDAAGKGGNIKRLTEELDPRGYEVVPIAAPTQEELNHHYLWRFYNKLPKDGHFGIFDRSWYGRVLVERVEKLCPVETWQRAYKEINDMEQHFANHGTIIFKFWLQIDKDEQLARFKARQADPVKQYKITEDDWRNREKWDLYETAVNDMLFRTNTEYAPWTIVESNSKKYARIKVLECVTAELDKILK